MSVAPAPPPARCRARRVLLLGACGVALALGTGAGALRLYDAWRGTTPRPGSRRSSSLHRIRSPGTDSGRGSACGAVSGSPPIRSVSGGEEIVPGKPPGTVRILCLGGSSVFCDGIPDAGTWPARLQEALRVRAGGGPVEVVNGGVNGYTSSQSLGLYLGRGAALSPDWVIAYQGWNDFKWWGHLSSEADWAGVQTVYREGFWYDRWFKGSALYLALRMRALAWQTGEGGTRPPPPPGEAFGPAGPAIWERNLRSLAAAARAAGSRLVLCDEARRLPPPAGPGTPSPGRGWTRRTSAPPPRSATGSPAALPPRRGPSSWRWTGASRTPRSSSTTMST
ncbi:MAG: SGNH/GDSL hydrolase family protein [Planctomycetes bacterium]|nr:SGNH/GDSL hydrolase family protein [Planctomycetota bacterium]